MEKPKVERDEDMNTNLSLLIDQMSQNDSLQNYTIELAEVNTSSTARRTTPRKEKNKKPMNLNEAFIKNIHDTQSTVSPSASSCNTQDLVLLDMLDTQKSGKVKLSSQCASNVSLFDVELCSTINNVSSIRSDEKDDGSVVTTDPFVAPPPPPPPPPPALIEVNMPPVRSSITIVPKEKRGITVNEQNNSLIDSDRDTSIEWPFDENRPIAAAAQDSIANRQPVPFGADCLVIRDTQTQANTQTFPSQVFILISILDLQKLLLLFIFNLNKNLMLSIS